MDIQELKQKTNQAYQQLADIRNTIESGIKDMLRNAGIQTLSFEGPDFKDFIVKYWNSEEDRPIIGDSHIESVYLDNDILRIDSDEYIEIEFYELHEVSDMIKIAEMVEYKIKSMQEITKILAQES